MTQVTSLHETYYGQASSYDAAAVLADKYSYDRGVNAGIIKGRAMERREIIKDFEAQDAGKKSTRFKSAVSRLQNKDMVYALKNSDFYKSPTKQGDNSCLSSEEDRGLFNAFLTFFGVMFLCICALWIGG